MSRFQVIGADLDLANLERHNQNWTKTDTELARVEAEVDAADASLQEQISAEQQARMLADSSHASALIAHAASQIALAAVSGMTAGNVQAAVAELAVQISNIVASAGDDNTEVVDGRLGADGSSRATLGTLIREIHAKLLAAAVQSGTLKHGMNLVTTDQAGPLDAVVYGRTLVNILGNDGNCESLTPFSTSGTVALSTTQKRNGSNSIKFTTSANNATAGKDFLYPLDSTKQYLFAGWVFIESYTDGGITFSLRDVGTTTFRYGVSTTSGIDSSKVGQWQFVYAKVPTSNALVGSGFRLYFGVSGIGTCVVYFDDIRLYEVSATDYAAIGSTITATSSPSIDDVWPYVDGVKHVDGVGISKIGKNMLPPMSEWGLSSEWTVTDPYSATWNTDGGSTISFSPYIECLPFQSYVFSCTHNLGAATNLIRLYTYDANMSLISNSGANNNVTRVVESNARYIRCGINEGANTGARTISNVQLELGSTPTTFTPRNDDYHFAPVTLASNIDGSVRDAYNTATKMVFRRIKTGFAFDGTLNVGNNSEQIGFKEIYVASSPSASPSGYVSGIRYDGMPFRSGTSTANGVRIGSGGNLIISVADADSGWDNAYIPSANDLKGLANGWKVNGYTTGTTVTDEATGSVAAAGTYTLAQSGKYKSVTVQKSSDNSTWASATEGTDYTVDWSASKAVITNPTASALYYKITYTYGVTANSWTSIVGGATPSTNTAAYVAANKAPGWTGWATIDYPIATPYEEPVVGAEGSISLHQGGNQIELMSGVVVRELVAPQQNSSSLDWFINSGQSLSPLIPDGGGLSKRAERIIGIYKNGVKDKGWTIVANTSGSAAETAYGKVRASISNSKFDPTAVYTVTYVALDKYLKTVNVVNCSISYNTNLQTVVAALVRKLADVETALTVVANAFATQSRTQVGSATGSIAAAGTAVTVNVTFQIAYAAAPKVQLTLTSVPGSAGYVNAIAENVTTTGFTLRLNAYATGAINVNWEAIGK